MLTAADIVIGAYRKLGLSPQDSDIESDEMNSGIEVLNDMMSELEGTGLVFGYLSVSNPADEVRIPKGTENGVKVNLAGYLAPNLDVAISPTLAAQITISTANMYNILRRPIKTGYPSTLPVGSGNKCGDYFHDEFFPSNPDKNF